MISRLHLAIDQDTSFPSLRESASHLLTGPDADATGIVSNADDELTTFQWPPPDRVICAHGPIYVYYFSRHP
jgi:hypothetical protein